MSGLENPFNLTPATADQFVGRTDILQRWRERLTPSTDAWNSAQSWLVIGGGGVGKTSLIHKMAQIAQDNFNAHVLYLDLGYYRQLNRDDDFFHYLDIRVPPAKTWSSRLRRWFDLPADASTGDVTKKFFSLLSHFAVAFSHVDWDGLGFEFGIPSTSSTQPTGFGLRLLQAFNTLAILSEEQERPVVLLVDQLDKTHDAYRWLLIAYQFLQFAEYIRLIQASNIVCVFTLRPERKGLLEYELEHYLRTTLFKRSVYHTEYLHPFQEQEAKTAIFERAKGKRGWDYNIAGKITQALNASSGIDPYHVILGASAVWQYLYENEEPKHPRDLDALAVYDIVRHGHGYLLDSVQRRSSTQWAILSLLAFYPAGLTVEAMTEQLNNRHKNLSLHEVEQAVIALSNQAGYRFLDTSPNISPVRYTLAHDLFRDYLQQQQPIEERDRERAQKILDDGTWRYQIKFTVAPFNQQELKLLREFYAQLSFTPVSWQAILSSELEVDETQVFTWLVHDREAVKKAHTELDTERTEPLTDFRYRLMAAYFYPQSKHLLWLLHQLAQQDKEDWVRLKAVEALGQVGEPALSVLCEVVRRDNEGKVREQAVQALGKLGKPALSVLCEAVQYDKNSGVRQQVVQALGQLGELALPMLGELVQQDKDIRIREQAIQVLGQLGKSALPILSELVQQNKDIRVHEQAVQVLGQLGEPALPMLSKLARYDKNNGIRQQAVEALGQLGEPALSVLLEAVRYDKNKWVRLTAVRSLGQLGEPALPVLSELAQQDKDNRVRQQAVQTLGQLGEPALPILRELAQYGKSNGVRQQAVETLGHFSEPALPLLSKLAQYDKDKGVRLKAIQALGQLGEPALPILRELAQQDKDNRVRQQAVQALGQLGEPALPLLSELAYQDKEDWIRTHAVNALEKLDEPFGWLGGLDKARLLIAQTLGQLGEPALVALHELAKQDKSIWVPLKQVASLGPLGRPALPTLRESTEQDNDIRVRLKAVEALELLGEPALPLLSELAQQGKDNRVRLQAVQALGQLGEPALPILRELIQQDKENWIRLEAVEALEQLGEPALSVLYEVVQQDKEDKVRLKAVEVLGQLGEPALPLLLQISWLGFGNGTTEAAVLHLVNILNQQANEESLSQYKTFSL